MTEQQLATMRQAYEVPLVEQLESVPTDARLVIDDADGMGTRFIPVGRMCHDAAKSLRTAIEQMESAEPVAFITPLMEQQMFDDWCPYKGSPDPRTVWAAAVEAVNGLLLRATPPAAQPADEPVACGYDITTSKEEFLRPFKEALTQSRSDDEQPAPATELRKQQFDHTAAANAALRDAQNRSYKIARTAQQQQEPVAYVYEREIDGFGLRKDVKFLKPVEVGADLYTSPPASKPLTNEQAAQQDIPDLIARALGVSRGTAYGLMLEALKARACDAKYEQDCTSCNALEELLAARSKWLSSVCPCRKQTNAWCMANTCNKAEKPAQRSVKPWRGLTEEDMSEIEQKAGITEDDDGYMVSQMFKLTEAKLREKNTGETK